MGGSGAGGAGGDGSHEVGDHGQLGVAGAQVQFLGHLVAEEDSGGDHPAFFGYLVEPDRAGWFANLAWPTPLPAFGLLDRVRAGDLVNVGAMHAMPPVPVWQRGRVVLVGDSAHATSPSSGQGASMSIESAVELARRLRDLPIPAALAAYESVRRPRVERVIAQTARVNSDKAAGPVARIIRDLTFPIAMRTFYHPEKMMGWMHRYAIDWAAPVPANR